MVRQIDVGPTGAGAAVQLLGGLVKGFNEQRERDLQREEKEKALAAKAANEAFGRHIQMENLRLNKEKAADQAATNVLTRANTKFQLLKGITSELQDKETEKLTYEFSKGLQDIAGSSVSEKDFYTKGQQLIQDLASGRTDSIKPGTIADLEAHLVTAAKFSGKPKENIQLHFGEDEMGNLKLTSVNKETGEITQQQLSSGNPLLAKPIQSVVEAANSVYDKKRNEFKSIYFADNNVSSLEALLLMSKQGLSGERAHKAGIEAVAKIEKFLDSNLGTRKDHIASRLRATAKSFGLTPEDVEKVATFYASKYTDPEIPKKELPPVAQDAVKQIKESFFDKGGVLGPDNAPEIMAVIKKNLADQPQSVLLGVIQEVEKMAGMTFEEASGE